MPGFARYSHPPSSLTVDEPNVPTAQRHRADDEPVKGESQSTLLDLIRGARHEVLSIAAGVPTHIGTRVVGQGPAGALLAVTTPSLVNALAAAFDQRWASATPWAAVCGQPDEFERSVLRHLVVGQTDDAVAGMERVGARSRFELGFRAAEFGWLDADLVAGAGEAVGGDSVDRASVDSCQVLGQFPTKSCSTGQACRAR